MSLNRSTTPSPAPAARREHVTRNDARIYQKLNISSLDLPRNAHDPLGSPVSAISEQDVSDDEEEEVAKHHARRLRRVGTLSKNYADDEEKAVIQKFDRKLVLFLAFLYLLSFLDRSSMLSTLREPTSR